MLMLFMTGVSASEYEASGSLGFGRAASVSSAVNCDVCGRHSAA